MIKLVAVDLDGTLFNTRNEITEETMKAIAGIREKGVEFLICTGRDYIQWKEMADVAGLTCKSISLGGASIFDEEGNRLDSITIPLDTVKEIIDLFQQEDLFHDIRITNGNCAISTMDKVMDYYTHDFYEGLKAIGKDLPAEEITKRVKAIKLFDSFEEFRALQEKVYKISSYSLDAQKLKRVKEILADNPTLAVASSFPTNIEITDVTAQKGNVLETYAKRKGIKNEEVMVIGDSDNDLSMFLKDFGCKVAMGNAEEPIKALADYVTRSNDEDGVAYAMNKFI